MFNLNKIMEGIGSAFVLFPPPLPPSIKMPKLATMDDAWSRTTQDFRNAFDRVIGEHSMLQSNNEPPIGAKKL